MCIRDRSGRTAFIIGGRYGLASKDFTPGDVISIIKNLKSEEPLNGFTVGITDDVTGLSLPAERNIPDTEPRNTISCKFWGLGSDGTVGANKSAIKIIGNHTDQYVPVSYTHLDVYKRQIPKTAPFYRNHVNLRTYYAAAYCGSE